MSYNFTQPRLSDILSLYYGNIRIFSLFMACVVYAFFGSPTPERFGVVECIVGVLLAYSIGLGGVYDVMTRQQLENRRFWKNSGQVFLLYGLSVPVLVGVIGGYGVAALLRDIIPFLFLFLPLFLNRVVRGDSKNFKAIFFAVILIGLVFSLRSLSMRFELFCPIWCSSELFYLENMPSVLFACLFLIGLAFHSLMHNVSVRASTVFLVLLMLSLLPILSMILTLQRASLGAVLVYVVVMIILSFCRMPLRSVRVIVALSVALLIINISFSNVFSVLMTKNEKVGFNMRPQEIAAVWEVVSVNPMNLLFGLGWGAQFNSPAVGGLSVNFTHNFFSSILLKSGLLGIIFALSYVLGLLERLSRVIIKSPMIGLAITAPVLIDLTLYASFKSLDFGLLLLMISSSLVYLRESEYETLNQKICADRQSSS